MKNNASTCPCANETAEELAASPAPDRVVTLVHGTFARHAPWMREGTLWQGFQPNPGDPDALPGRTLFSRFCWSGANTHTDRLTAGDALHAHLDGLTTKFPHAKHFVIGHSHGGNVMLYALKDPSLADRIAGLVTLATPFITVRRRKLHPLVLTGILTICLLGTVEAALQFAHANERSLKVVVATNNMNLLAQQSVILMPKAGAEATPEAKGKSKEAEAAAVVAKAAVAEANRFQAGWWIASVMLLWLFASMASALRYRGKAFGWQDLTALILRSGAEPIVARELDRLRLTPETDAARKKLSDKLLVARPIGDEAAMSLVASQFFSWVQNHILTMLSASMGRFWKLGWFSWLPKVVVAAALLFVVAMVLPNTVDAFFVLGEAPWVNGLFGVHWILRDVTLVAIVMFSAVSVVYGLLCLIGLLVLAAAALPFGLDALFWNHYFSTTAESSPPGTARVFLQSPPPGTGEPGLVHSGIYSDTKVINAIVDWIREREAAIDRTANAGSSVASR
ncbi:triacylglycerol lipase [Rhodoferax sp. PAMC 29310]|uniref:esterase/lipase family protein n=1 Tax=Rhodoferax sp. PAMC 29310 TaxID=2822760 RepID=UPI001B342D8C|nr:hypothetical protein [Rhodoferax sp. PAMC 29310]